MTREQLQKHWKEIEAWKDGATIQKLKNGYHGNYWDIVNEPCFELNGTYRIKPEPEYIQFDFEDVEKFIGKAVIFNNNFTRDFYCIVTGLEGDKVSLGNGNSYSLKVAFEHFVFADTGLPFGKLK